MLLALGNLEKGDHPIPPLGFTGGRGLDWGIPKWGLGRLTATLSLFTKWQGAPLRETLSHPPRE